MSLSSLLKRLTKALPVILASAPVVIDAARQVQQAFKKPKPSPSAGGDAAVSDRSPPQRRLNADREPAAR